jgi:hypothetical protein
MNLLSPLLCVRFPSAFSLSEEKMELVFHLFLIIQLAPKILHIASNLKARGHQSCGALLLSISMCLLAVSVRAGELSGVGERHSVANSHCQLS